MSKDLELQLLRDAAMVHVVSRDVVDAIAALAVRPLDEGAAVRMRQVLAGDHSAAQASLRRLRLLDSDAPSDPGEGQ